MEYRKISFPKDGLKHDNIIEWWYFNGHLHDSRGNYYAFMDCLFKADPKKVNIPIISRIPMKYVYFSHSLLSDAKNRKFYTDINPMVVTSQDSFTKPLMFVDYTLPSLKGYFNYEIYEIKPFKFRLKSKFFDLILTSRKKPLLEGGKGFLNLNSKQTYYYSLTNMETKGWITIGSRRVEVSGKSWMDHQWADVPYSADKWTWFSVQLDNNCEMVCFEYDDRKKKTYLASMIDRKGSAFHTTDVKIIPKGKGWESPKTGAKYPLSWEITAPSFKIELTLSPIIKEQEMFFSAINYWEGPMKVSGTMKGKKVSGMGFMELASYPMNKTFVGMYRDAFRKSINDYLAQIKERMRGQ